MARGQSRAAVSDHQRMNPGKESAQCCPVPTGRTFDEGLESRTVGCFLLIIHRCDRPIRYTTAQQVLLPGVAADANLEPDIAGPRREELRLPMVTAAVEARRWTLPYPGGSGDQTATETDGHRLGAVPGSQLAEQPARVRLDGVLRQEQFFADLTVGLTLTHPAQYL